MFKRNPPNLNSSRSPKIKIILPESRIITLRYAGSLSGMAGGSAKTPPVIKKIGKTSLSGKAGPPPPILIAGRSAATKFYVILGIFCKIFKAFPKFWGLFL